MRFALTCILAFSIWCFPVQADTIERGIFAVEYAQGEEELAKETLAILEKGLAEFDEHLPAGKMPIRVIVCSDIATFQRNAGSMGTMPVEGIAESWRSRIVVKSPSLRRQRFDYSGTLRHELVHVLLARNTDMAQMPRWLNEGIAMAVAKDYRWESMLYLAQVYYNGQIISYTNLNFAFAAPRNEGEFGAAYAQAYSMTRFLIKRMGEERFWEMVAALNKQPFGPALREYAGFSVTDFFQAWKASLWKVALIASLVSGLAAFQLMAVLVVLAYWRKHRHGRRIMRQWAEEEAEEDGRPYLFAHELEDQEEPGPWEDEDEEEYR